MFWCCVRFAITLHGFAHSDETKSDKISSLWHISRNFSPSARHVHSHISTLLNYSIIFTWTCILLFYHYLYCQCFFFRLPWRIEFCCHHNSHAIIVVRSRVSLLPIFFPFAFVTNRHQNDQSNWTTDVNLSTNKKRHNSSIWSTCRTNMIGITYGIKH